MPYFNELAAKSVLDDIKRNPIFTLYLPDLDGLRRTPNRKYMFNVSCQLIILADPLTLLSIDRELTRPELLH